MDFVFSLQLSACTSSSNYKICYLPRKFSVPADLRYLIASGLEHNLQIAIFQIAAQKSIRSKAHDRPKLQDTLARKKNAIQHAGCPTLIHGDNERWLRLKASHSSPSASGL
eukprot:237120-Hanusia_phi.AAC.1